jgi:hypothetical protein
MNLWVISMALCFISAILWCLTLCEIKMEKQKREDLERRIQEVVPDLPLASIAPYPSTRPPMPPPARKR